jgi:hypothetical protein
MTLNENSCTSYSFPSDSLEKATLGSTQVQAFIKSAYEYHLVYFGRQIGGPNVTHTVLNVTGTQVVTGNWTTGYRVSYLANALLNVTVQHPVPSTYDVTHLSVYPLPDRNESIAFTTQQMRAIQMAISDPKVKALMVRPPYFVQSAKLFSNGTINNAYFVQLYQVGGTGFVGAFVNQSFTAVVASYGGNRVSSQCLADGTVITDPWNASVKNIQCTAQPIPGQGPPSIMG